MADPYSESRRPVTRRTLFHVRCVAPNAGDVEEFPELADRACDRLLAELVSTPFRLRCPRCKRMNVAGVDGEHSVEVT